jgi:hypothetical protein
MTGKGSWKQGKNHIDITWVQSTTKESWDLPISETNQTGTVQMKDGTFKLAAVKTSSSHAGKRIVVNLWRQVLYALDGDKTVFTFDCVSGDTEHPSEEVEENVPGRPRPIRYVFGDVVTHAVIKKDRWARSAKYGNVEMFYALFFTHDGKAIHQGTAVGFLSHLKVSANPTVGGLIGSHGCVRLSEDHAGQLFSWAVIGTPIILVGHAGEQFPETARVRAALKKAGAPGS